MATETEPRVIKRYANRKLYDMQESCYITHDEIASLVKGGEDVQIIDNKTKEDLTTLTLTQILFREEKMQRKGLPLHALRGILQSGGDFIQRQITDPLQTLRDEAEETVRTISHVFRRDEEGNEVTDDDVSPSHAPDTPAVTADALNEDGRNPAAAMREWVDSTQKSIETFQRTFEERWSLTFNALTLINESRQRIAELEARVAQLEAQLSQAHKEKT
jgi:polyhydroxyalkanoate synthesis repressor PhaR